MVNMSPTAILRFLFMFNDRTQTSGNISRMMSCRMADAALANPRALMSRHFPLTSRFQNARTGRQLKIVKQKMTSVLMMM